MRLESSSAAWKAEKADEKTRAYEERRKAASGNAEKAEAGAAILFGLLMLNAAGSGARP